MRTQEIDQQLADLKERESQLANERKLAEQAERQAKLDRLVALQNEAADYRSQAEQAASEADKKSLYRFAASADKEANDIRAELNLPLNPIEPEPEPVDTTEGERDKAYGVVNSLLVFVLSMGVACMITGYSAAQIDAGIWAFLLDTAAHLTRAGFLVSAVVWVSLRAVLWFTPANYFPVGLYEDFTGAEPRTRLYILAGMAISVLYLLSAIIHAK
jgi:hypothetical protein